MSPLLMPRARVIGRVKRLGSDREAAPLAYHRGQVWPLFSDKARDASQ